MQDGGLLEKFLLEIAIDKAKAPINRFFTNLKIDAVQVFINGVPLIHGMTSNEDNHGEACMNGILFGVAMVEASKHPEFKKQVEGFLEFQGRRRGENVINFHQKKAEMRK